MQLQETVYTEVKATNALLVQLPLSASGLSEFLVSMSVMEENYIMEAQCTYCFTGECPEAMIKLEAEAALNLTTFRYGMQLQYGCGKGKVFNEGGLRHIMRDVECQWDGNWSIPELPPCECKLKKDKYASLKDLTDLRNVQIMGVLTLRCQTSLSTLPTITPRIQQSC